MPIETDILVVGAGPVGLAASLLAAKLGFATATIAPARTATDERTSALLAGSTAFLTDLGIWPAIASEAAPMRSLRIVDATRRLIRAPEVLFHASEIGLDAFGHNIPNAALVGALEAAVSERIPARLTGAVERLRTEEARTVAALADGTEISARLVIAADGRRSKVRESLGIGERAWRYDQSALVVNLRHTVPHDDTSTEFHTEAGPFTLVPLPGLRSSLVWVDRPAESARRLQADDAALADAIEERSQSILGRIAIDGPRQVFPLSGMTATRFGAGRAVLVGESAHVFPPIGAQGLNLGYRDLAGLGAILARGGDDPGSPATVAAYTRERAADIVGRTVGVDLLNRSLLSDLLPIQGMRSVGLFLLDRVPPLRRALMRIGAGQ